MCETLIEKEKTRGCLSPRHGNGMVAAANGGPVSLMVLAAGCPPLGVPCGIVRDGLFGRSR